GEGDDLVLLAVPQLDPGAVQHAELGGERTEPAIETQRRVHVGARLVRAAGDGFHRAEQLTPGDTVVFVEIDLRVGRITAFTRRGEGEQNLRPGRLCGGEGGSRDDEKEGGEVKTHETLGGWRSEE